MRTLALILILTCAARGADLMPDGINRTNTIWRVAGVIGGIPTNQTFFTNVYHAGADKTGVTNASTIIAARFNAASSNSYVLVPAGVYSIGASMTLNNNGTVLRGEGMDVTYLVVTNNNEITFGPGGLESGTLPTISSGGTKGSTSVTLSSVTGISAGETCRFLYAGTNAMPWAVEWSESNQQYYVSDNDPNKFGQEVYVQSISGTTITFSPPLTADCTHADSRVRAMSGSPMCMSGVEDMTIITDKSAGTTATFQFNGTVNCWNKGVKYVNVPTRGIVINRSCHAEIRKCFLNNDRVPAANGGDCITFFYSNSGCMIIDSIFYKGEPGVKFGDGLSYQTLGNSGNVIAYNYFAVPNNGGGDIWLIASAGHGYHHWGQLWEGNVFNGYMQDDGYHGSSSHGTWFRNRMTGHSDAVDVNLSNVGCLSLNRFSYTNTVIGNVLGDNSYTFAYMPTNSDFTDRYIFRLGYPNMGNNGFDAVSGGEVPLSTATYNYFDRSVSNSAFIHWNYDTVTDKIIVISGYESNSLPASFFLSAKPSWFGDRPWPPIDPGSPSTSVNTNIPAGFRYVFGTDPPAEGSGVTLATRAAAQGKVSALGKVIVP